MEGEAEEGLRRGEQRHPLGPLHHADLRVDAERLGARPGVRDEKRSDDGGEADDDHDDVRVERRQDAEERRPARRARRGGDRLAGVEDRQPAEDGAVGDAVERRVEEGAEGAGAPRPPGDRPVEDVEEGGEAEEPAGRADVAGRVDHAAGHRTEGTEDGDGVGRDAGAHEHVGDRLDDSQVAALNRFPQSLHSSRARRAGTGPAPPSGAGRREGWAAERRRPKGGSGRKGTPITKMGQPFRPRRHAGAP